MKNRFPLISVVMLNYNGLKYLRRTIPPILKLDYPNYEFIIVDNGSTDGSIEFIKRFKKIKLIENGKNLGYSKGKNIGVKYTKGEYVLLLDEDILIKKDNILKIFLNHYIQNNKTAFLNPLIVDLGNKKTKYYGNYLNYKDWITKESININKIKSINGLIKIPVYHGGIFFIKKSIFNQIGLIDESQPYLIDDQDMGIRANLFGYSNFLLPSEEVIHLGIDRLQGYFFNWKYKYYFSGNLRTMLKNYILLNVLKRGSYFIMFSFFKTLKQTIIHLDPRIFGSYIYSNFLFLKNLPDTLKQRKIIQSKRVIKEDIFLKIKPPKFD